MTQKTFKLLNFLNSEGLTDNTYCGFVTKVNTKDYFGCLEEGFLLRGYYLYLYKDGNDSLTAAIEHFLPIYDFKLHNEYGQEIYLYELK